MATVKKCITLTPEQDKKIRALQIKMMSATKENVSYSRVVQMAITEGLAKFN